MTAALGASVLIGALAPAPASAQELDPPVVRTPAAPLGTVLLLPGSGWASPTPAAQERVLANVGDLYHDAGYRVAAYDYAYGPAAALQSVRRAVVAEHRRLKSGPLCVYGESSGGHLALLLANRMRIIDCVITFGAPTSFVAYAEEAAERTDQPGYQYSMENHIVPMFGSDPAEWAPWEPASIVTPVRTPVLMMITADDPIVPVDQIFHLPGAKTYIPPRGDISDPDDLYVHGSVSDEGRIAVQRRVLAFVEAARKGEPAAKRRRARKVARVKARKGRAQPRTKRRARRR